MAFDQDSSAALDSDSLAQVSGGSEPTPERERVHPMARAAPAQPKAAPPAASVPAPAAPSAGPAKPAQPRRPWRRLVLVAVLAAALGYGGYEARHWWTEGRFLVGTDDAYVQADITLLAAKVSGYVASVEVADNQAVKAGDVIARIDDGDYRLALQAARDKLATQDGTIARIARQIEAAKASVARAEAQLAAARADAARAAADYARQVQLARADFASRARLDQATADRDRSEAAVRSAEAALAAERANVDVLAAQKMEAERVAGELRTAVAKAERDLSFTVIRAPIDGIVGNRAIEVGAFVQPGTRLAALVPLDSIHVDANFKETQIEGIAPGQKVRISVDAFPDRDVPGTVESIAPASGSVFSLLPPENATGNFTKIVQRVPVRIAVAPEVVREGILRPGLSVVVDVDTRSAPAASEKLAQR
ncbi:HlyD family secretion protein [Benzoatithermus flavus]|uniref:HlyD family secretion protein n=1 Tax=Benzoatithermus flavus TaxID=3108223 RepID=A0ABU8XK04_9PROT